VSKEVERPRIRQGCIDDRNQMKKAKIGERVEAISYCSFERKFNAYQNTQRKRGGGGGQGSASNFRKKNIRKVGGVRKEITFA